MILGYQPTVAFDVDGTLISLEGKPRYDVIQVFLTLQSFGCDMFVWSGSGDWYAQNWVDKLGLEATVVVKGSFKPDLTFDDMAHEKEFNLATVNISVCPSVKP